MSIGKLIRKIREDISEDKLHSDDVLVLCHLIEKKYGNNKFSNLTVDDWKESAKSSEVIE